LYTLRTVPSAHHRAAPVGSFGLVSSFPPTSCGIATFSAALSAGLVACGSSVDVVRSGAAPDLEDALVVAALADGSRHHIEAATEALNHTDVVIVQHEYGLYDGLDGESIIDLLAGVEVPIIVVAHTVLSEPTPHQRAVLEQICRLAQVVVVMTATARDRLVAGFDVAPAKVTVIPHGATTPRSTEASDPDRPARRAPLALTWGLLGPGKGIEWAIDAMAQLVDLRPSPEYLVAGATHPKVRERSGESYRRMLVERAGGSPARSQISFDDTYRDLESLTRLIRTADVVVLPYDSDEQVTSGVLVDAVAAGRPVVSTAFPHAVELLASGAGIVVPQRDPDALAGAIRTVLTDHRRAASMAAEARRLAPDLSWGSVARHYQDLGRLVSRPPAVVS
jgi:polysaccharide biosynthesis protein PslF